MTTAALSPATPSLAPALAPTLSHFATLPAPPYYAVIFSALASADTAGYAQAAYRMAQLAPQQPGFLGMESTHGADGFGITVSYWASEAAIAAWRANAEHRTVQEAGKARWCERLEIRVARVERAHGHRQL